MEGNLADRVADLLKAKDDLINEVDRLAAQGHNLQNALEIESNKRAAAQARMEELFALVERYSAAFEPLIARVAELQWWRDTGAIHKQCRPCEQFLPIDRNGRFPRHFGRFGQCINSGGEA